MYWGELKFVSEADGEDSDTVAEFSISGEVSGEVVTAACETDNLTPLPPAPPILLKLPELSVTE